MKYLVNPYNKTAYHEKHMSFDEGDKHNLLFSSDVQESQSWKKLFELIVKEDKHEMRRFLTHVNQRFYEKLAKLAALEERKKKKKTKVRQTVNVAKTDDKSQLEKQNDAPDSVDNKLLKPQMLSKIRKTT